MDGGDADPPRARTPATGSVSLRPSVCEYGGFNWGTDGGLLGDGRRGRRPSQRRRLSQGGGVPIALKSLSMANFVPFCFGFQIGSFIFAIMTDNDYSPYLNRNDAVDVNVPRTLPHWNQSDKIQFVTFRLADSLPRTFVMALKRERSDFERLNPRPWNPDTAKRFRSLMSRKVEEMLDNGYGECLLRDSTVRKYVSETLRFYDGRLYELLSYVIMPNHVHLLVRVTGDNRLADIVRNIKGYSAKIINNCLHREGPLWMKEYHDRIIRNEDHLKNCLRYIRSNPRFLPATDYELK